MSEKKADIERNEVISGYYEEKILLIDDDPVEMDLISNIVSSAMNVNVLTASTWEEGMDKALYGKPFIIILNLFFSIKKNDSSPYFEDIKKEILGEEPIINEIDKGKKDGFSLSYNLKAATNSLSIPILGVGPVDTPYLKKMAFKAGCSDYLGKPFGMNDLIDKLRRLIF